ncbi:MAG: UDP-N-acetylmuramate--L-alanine ligase [Gammaproteobacteria bacterium]
MSHSPNKPKRIHFLGIGGSGMSGLAEVLINMDFEVSGVDLIETEVTQRLKSLGAKIYLGHKKSNINNVDMLIVSSAIDNKNEELIEAKKRNLPTLARAELLSSLMNLKKGIAIAGTHGKTTTTSILAQIMTDFGLEPTFITGGIINSFATNAKLGSGEYLIAEADESDKSFLMLQPSLAVITNIEEDHLSNYENNFDKLKEAFVEFVKKIPFDGLVVACGDDFNTKSLLPRFSRRVLTYGFQESNDFVIKSFKANGKSCSFSVFNKERGDMEFNLNMLGRHNALNAVAAIVVALDEGVEIEDIKNSLKQFSGIGRRMEVMGNIKLNDKNTLLIDDYGHHPTEIKSTYLSIKESYPDSEVVMVFQPHRYTRTKELFNEFLDVLSEVDKVLLLDIYSAGEDPIDGISGEIFSKKLAERTKKPKLLVKEEDLINSLNKEIQSENTILLMQGAGTISSLTQKLLKEYS